MNPSDDFADNEKAASFQIKAAYATLREAKLLLENEAYNGTLNRSYYAVFHAICAIHALDEKSYKRHKDTIGNFNKEYVRTGIFPREYGGKIVAAESARHSGDYSEYFEPSQEEARAQYEFAEEFVGAIAQYVETRRTKG